MVPVAELAAAHRRVPFGRRLPRHGCRGPGWRGLGGRRGGGGRCVLRQASVGGIVAATNNAAKMLVIVLLMTLLPLAAAVDVVCGAVYMRRLRHALTFSTATGWPRRRMNLAVNRPLSPLSILRSQSGKGCGYISVTGEPVVYVSRLLADNVTRVFNPTQRDARARQTGRRTEPPEARRHDSLKTETKRIRQRGTRYSWSASPRIFPHRDRGTAALERGHTPPAINDFAGVLPWYPFTHRGSGDSPALDAWPAGAACPWHLWPRAGGGCLYSIRRAVR